MRDVVVKKHLKVIQERHGDLEAACVHCGACCYAKVRVGGMSYVIKSLRCKYLGFREDGTSFCTVYERRHEVAPWCKNLTFAIKKQVLPAECPYVDGLARYRGPVVLEGKEYRAIEAAARGTQARLRCPPWCDPALPRDFVAGGRR